MKYFADVTVDVGNGEGEFNLPTPSNPTTGTIIEGVQIVLGIFAAAAVLIIAIQAIKISIARGNSEEVAKARNAIIYAAVGLAISLSAFTIVAFVLNNI